MILSPVELVSLVAQEQPETAADFLLTELCEAMGGAEFTEIIEAARRTLHPEGPVPNSAKARLFEAYEILRREARRRGGAGDDEARLVADSMTLARPFLQVCSRGPRVCP